VFAGENEYRQTVFCIRTAGYERTGLVLAFAAARKAQSNGKAKMVLKARIIARLNYQGSLKSRKICAV
jgi:hypothetical protein